MRTSWTALTLALALPAALLAADALKSGLPVGDQVPAFNVRDITGPNKGKTLCYRCKYGDRPVVAVFTRKVDNTVSELVKKIDAQVAKNEDKKMAAFIVVLTDEPDALEPKLETIAKESKVEHTPLTIVEGQTGPPDYKLAKDAEVTVMMWVESTVKVNHAFEKGKLDKAAIEMIVKDTQKILN